MQDNVERMLQEIGARRRADEPLGLTATGVFHENIEGLSEAEYLALATVGYAAVAEEGGAWPIVPGIRAETWPHECPPATRQAIDSGTSKDQVDFSTFSDVEVVQLALVGLWTLGGEYFAKADAGN